MGADSSIGWTAYERGGQLVAGYTFNCWWGCVRVSPACGTGSAGGCYAEAWAKRTGHDVWGVSAPRRFFGDKHGAEPLKWNRQAERAGTKPHVFCMSMGDLFEDRPDLVEPRDRLLRHGGLIDQTPRLIWMLLTKRPENIADMVPEAWIQDQWPSDVWIGITAEDQRRFDERYPHLVATRAPVKFLSCEPLLEHINLRSADVQWIIVGGESGGGAREMDLEAARDLAYQADRINARLYVKQLGTVLAKKRLPMAEWKMDRKGERLEALPSELRSREWPGEWP